METPLHENNEKKDLLTEDNSEIRQIEMEAYELAVKKARNGLFIAAALLFVGEMIAMARMEEFNTIFLGFAIVEAGIFLALAFYTKKKPYTAIVLGLIAFAGVITLSAVVYGMAEGGVGVLKALFSGILIKIFIFVALIRPLGDAKRLQQLKEEA